MDDAIQERILDRLLLRAGQIGFSVAQRRQLRYILTNPSLGASETPLPEMPKVIVSTILKKDIAVMVGMTLNSEDCRVLFWQLGHARYKIYLIHQKLLKTEDANKSDLTQLLKYYDKYVELRGKIATGNMGLVLAMAKCSHYPDVEFTDLISEGSMALLRATDKFDCNRGFQFSTYACKAILKSFSRAAKRYYRYRGFFPSQLDPSIEKDNYLEELRQDSYVDKVSQIGVIFRNNTANLTSVETSVVKMRFSLNDYDNESYYPMTLKQVGQRLNLSKERIRQIQNKALSKLRVAVQHL
jgi:RNA polymerase sigma factor (sigma-70 family)